MHNGNRDKSWESYYSDWLFGKKSLGDIALDAKVSTKTVQRRFKGLTFDEKPLAPVSGAAIPLIIDATFFGREWGLLCYHDTNRVIHIEEIVTEGARDLRKGLRALSEAGYRFASVTLDGKPGFAQSIWKLHPHLPVQMCHFHQQAIVRRHLRSSPNCRAKRELAVLMLHLNGDPQVFIDRFSALHRAHYTMLHEKKLNGKYRYKKLRSAYESIRCNLPHLFVYQEMDWLNIPNTTNHLEGAFAHMKKYLSLHQGLSVHNKKKAAKYLLKCKK